MRGKLSDVWWARREAMRRAIRRDGVRVPAVLRRVEQRGRGSYQMWWEAQPWGADAVVFVVHAQARFEPGDRLEAAWDPRSNRAVLVLDLVADLTRDEVAASRARALELAAAGLSL